MSVYITDPKKGVVRHYCTDSKTDKAVETLLSQMIDIVSSETHPGYGIEVVKKEADGREQV